MFNCGCAQQAGQLRRQHAAAPGGRRADPQQATRLYLQAGHVGLGLLHLLQHLPASGQVGAAGFGQALAAGVPLQQRGTQVRLQLLDVLAHHHRRDLQLFGGAGEAATLGHGNEGLHAAKGIHY
jgi:hypothetical protein